MKQITKELLMAIAPYVDVETPWVSPKSAETFAPYLVLHQGDVNTVPRMAAFLANVLHESGCLKWVRELASGNAYEGRATLGNTFKGDGPRFKGRGLIQVTGRANYAECSRALFGSEDVLLGNPDMLATPENAVRSAYWFWNKNKLNEVADTGDFVKVVRRINGGTNGLAERQKYYEAAKKLLV